MAEETVAEFCERLRGKIEGRRVRVTPMDDAYIRDLAEPFNDGLDAALAELAAASPSTYPEGEGE